MQSGVQNLGIRETEELAEFLLYHMSMEMRSRLMAERPTIYATLYPSVSKETIAFRVVEEIERERANHA